MKHGEAKLEDSLNPAAGITGGFAGGEKGVKQFVESGDIKFADKGILSSMLSDSSFGRRRKFVREIGRLLSSQNHASCLQSCLSVLESNPSLTQSKDLLHVFCTQKCVQLA